MAAKEAKSATTKTVQKKKKSGPNKVSKFFKEMIVEIKKITWPTGKQVLNNMLITLAAMLIIGAAIWIFDFILNYGRDFIFDLLA